MRADRKNVKDFQSAVWDYYEKSGRHDLPWRTTDDPYKILVSEVMLQQTQVERVAGYYARFVNAYPTPKKLAGAALSDVLRRLHAKKPDDRNCTASEIAELLEGVGRRGATRPRWSRCSRT